MSDDPSTTPDGASDAPGPVPGPDTDADTGVATEAGAAEATVEGIDTDADATGTAGTEGSSAGDGGDDGDEPGARVRARRRVRVDPHSGTPRRLVAGGLIAVTLAALVAIDDRTVRPEVELAAETEAIVLPPDRLLSAAWYCPGGLPGDPGAVTASEDDDPEATTPLRDTVFVTNTSERDASVRVTVFTAAAEPVGRRVAVAAGEVVALPVRDLSDAPDASVMVESFGPGIVVEEQVGAPDRDDVAVGPCATQTSASWYFAAGSTLRDSTQWLSLLNPYAEDAVVDITVITNNAVRRPSDLQSFVVPAHSRRSVFVNDAADRKQIVALAIQSPQGDRVVAQQTVVHRGAGRRVGVSSTIGAVAPGRRFTFAGGNARSDTTRLIYVMNPGAISADVDVLVTAPGASPTTITVEPESVVAVNINKIAPRDSKYAVIVEATAGFGEAASSGRGVVVEDFEGLRIESRNRTVFGVAGGVGAVAPATEWRFGVSEIDDDTRGQIQVYNPNAETMRVDIAYVLGGEIVRPADLQGVEVEGSTQRDIRIDSVIEQRVGLIVTLSAPGYAERFLVRDESVTRALGIPRRD